MSEVFKMPALGITMTEGVVLEWLKQEGDSFEEGETLVMVETDKVEVEVPAPFAGTVVKHLVDEQTEVPVGESIATLAPKDPSTGG